MPDHTPTRADEIKAIHREYKFFYQLLGGSLLVAIGILIGAIAFSSDLDRSAYFINLYTSLLSILVTVFVIDFLNRRREDQRELRQLQQQLIHDAGSTSNEIAKNAVHQLNMRGWLEGDNGLLRGAYLYNANLEGADLFKANLEGADLHSANLEKGNLISVNLQGANLQGANLHKAYVSYANMQGSCLVFANLQEVDFTETNLKEADLRYAKLQGAHFRKTNLEGADLSDANLQGAHLTDASLRSEFLSLEEALQKSKFVKRNLDENTILPDRTHWTPDTDLTKFTRIISKDTYNYGDDDGDDIFNLKDMNDDDDDLYGNPFDNLS
jgi:hypothetical protein